MTLLAPSPRSGTIMSLLPKWIFKLEFLEDMFGAENQRSDGRRNVDGIPCDEEMNFFFFDL